MGLSKKLAQRARAEPEIPTGRVSQVGRYGYNQTLSPFRSRTASLLNSLRAIPDEADAIDFLRKKTPDAGMALWNFVRLSNQGHQMKFYDVGSKDKELPEVEAEWKEFASRINRISNQGLDGLINIMHTAAYLFGNQMVEIEVNADRTDIVDVHPIDPRTITWELEERDGQKIWVPYQQQAIEKVDLSKGNIFYVPTDPDIDDPRGNLLMVPALQSIDYQLQTLQDVAMVLRKQGYPRNDIAIDRETLFNAMPPNVKGDVKKQRDFLIKYWNEIKEQMDGIEPTQDLLHYNDLEIKQLEGGNAGRSLDVRAVQELIDIQVMSGLKQLGSLNNRINSHTETFSTVEFKIVVQGVMSMQRGSKRILEEVARLWLRVRGIQATPTFTHNVIDWQSEKDKIDVKLKQQEYWAKAQLFGWVDADYAAQQAMGVENAVGEMPIENVRVSLGRGGDSHTTDEQLPGGLQQGEKKRARSRLGVI